MPAIDQWLKTYRGKKKASSSSSSPALSRRVSGRLHPSAEAFVAELERKAAAAPPARREFLERKPDKHGHVRRGRVFTLRLEPRDEEALKALQLEHERQSDAFERYGYQRRGGLGSFIVWAALQYKPAARR